MKIIKKELEFYSRCYLEIIKIINSAGGNARIIGGAVRDALLETFPSDIDIATKLKPDQLIELFQKHNIKTIPTGIKFGTITVIYPDESFQVTTLRLDVACDGRHAEVVYTDDYKEDAKRRDFTINALSYCPIKQEIYDYFGGIEDLQNRRVIFIGDPNERIQEDYLRILRFFRFSCKYADAIDWEGENACRNNKEMLQTLSKERIKSEMDKIILSKKSCSGLFFMEVDGILDMIFPKYYFDMFLHDKMIIIINSYQYYDYINIMYASLFYGVTITANDLMELKFSKKDSLNVLKLIEVSKFKGKDIYEYLLEIWLNEDDFVQYFIVLAAHTDKREEV